MTRARDVADVQDNTGGAVAPFTAGKNRIINGDFFINQRGFSSSTVSGDYTFDRWKIFSSLSAGSATYSAQTFTAGTAPVTGYEARNYFRCVTSGTASANTASYSFFTQYIEDVRTFANQKVTVSFWAKASSGTPKVALELTQTFGSGGTPSANVNTYAGQATLSTSWARYSITATVPSINGKTIGTTANTSALLTTFWVTAGSDFNSRTGSLGLQDNTFEFWGVQIEAGSAATPFQTATGTIQGELAACQRYFIRITNTSANTWYGFACMAISTTRTFGSVALPVTLRSAPTLTLSSVTVYDAGTNYSVSSGSAYAFGGNQVTLDLTNSAATAAYALRLLSLGTNSYFELSSEY